MSTDTIGSGKDHADIWAWEAALPGTLSEPEIGAIDEISDQDTGQFVIAGHTTSAANYIKLTVNSSYRHDGTRNSGARFVYLDAVGSPGQNAGYIEIDDDYVEIEWLEITGTLSTGNNVYTIMWTTDDMDYSRIAYNFFYDITGHNGRIIHATANHYEMWIENNLCADINTSNCRFIYLSIYNPDHDAVAYVYNNTCEAYGGTFCYNIAAVEDPYTVDIYFKNNIGTGAVGDYFYSSSGPNATIHADYNASEDDTADDNGGTGNQTGISPANEYVDDTAGSEDLHLDSGTSTLLGDGIGPNSDGNVPDYDIDGDSRIGQDTCDIGADETAAGTEYDRSTEGSLSFGGSISRKVTFGRGVEGVI